MSLQEVLFRVRRGVAIELERRADHAIVLPEPDFSALTVDVPASPDIDPAPYVRKAERLMSGRMDVFAIHDHFLGDPPEWNRDPKTGTVAPLSFGKKIDYRNEGLVGNIKYLWEPSRHLGVSSLAQAYRLTGETRFLKSLVRHIDSWIEQCPYPMGVHWCSALEVAIRLINWSFAWRIAGGIDAFRQDGIDDRFVDRWLGSIYRHLQFIDAYYSGHSSANNHLIGEAAGVYVACLTWPAWPACDDWRLRARQILIDETGNQTFDDGVNKEQAISYQQFVLDFFVIAGIAAQRNDDPLSDLYWENIEKMMAFVHGVMDVNGNVPMIGDADDGFVVDVAAEADFCNFRSLLATGAVLFDRDDFARKAGKLDSKTQWLVEDAVARFPAPARPDAATDAGGLKFPSGGYYVFGSHLDWQDEVRIVIDAGPLGLGPLAAHGHADALSFTLSVAGVPVIIDPGTYAYHSDKKWRDYFRGTAAHNTVRVDGEDQSEIGGNFMWKRHAAVSVEDVQCGGQLQQLTASHDGYARFGDPVIHRRRIGYDRSSRELRIEDSLQCKLRHSVEIYFQFPEYASVSCSGSDCTVRARGTSVLIEPQYDLLCETFQGDRLAPAGWVSYRFDMMQAAHTLRYSGTISGSSTFVTVLKIA